MRRLWAVEVWLRSEGILKQREYEILRLRSAIMQYTTLGNVVFWKREAVETAYGTVKTLNVILLSFRDLRAGMQLSANRILYGPFSF